MLNPRAYDGAVFQMISGTDDFAFRQNTTRGGQPIALFSSSTKLCTFYGDCSIPNFYNKSSIDTLISNIYDDVYIKTEIDTLFSNIDSSTYYTKNEVDDIGNELSTLILNTYNKSEIDTFSTDYYNIGYLNIQLGLKANGSNTYTKSEVDNMITLLDISSMLNCINNNGTNIVDILNTRYTKSEVDTLISTYYNNTETGNMLNQKVHTSGNSVIQSNLDAYLFRCGEIKVKSDDDLNSLTMTQLAAHESIIDLRTEESFASVYLKIKGTSYIGLSTTNSIIMYMDTAIDGDLTTGNTTINGY